MSARDCHDCQLCIKRAMVCRLQLEPEANGSQLAIAADSSDGAIDGDPSEFKPHIARCAVAIRSLVVAGVIEQVFYRGSDRDRPVYRLTDRPLPQEYASDT